jgi:hypothetical protein
MGPEEPQDVAGLPELVGRAGLMGRRWLVSAGLAGLVGALLLLGLVGCGSAGGRATGSRPPVSGASVSGASVSGASVSGGAGGKGASALRRLRVRESWDIQLDRPPRAPFPAVGLIETDGFDTPKATVKALHQSRRGRVVVCYLDAGTWEQWRPDAGQYPKSLLGRPDNGWAGERWLDIRQYRGPFGDILRARVQMCRAKGFDAVDFDNVDGYTNGTGFGLTAAGQLRFNRFLAGLAHQAGLLVALKNDPGQIAQLWPDFDFAVDEQCYQDGGCDLSRFVAAGKPAFDIEYALAPGKFCPTANRENVNALRKHLALDAWRVACR